MERLLNRSARLRSVFLFPGMAAIATTIVTLLVLVAVMVPDGAFAKPVKTQVGLEAVGLVYSDGSYDYVFGAVLRPPRRVRDVACLAGREVRIYRDQPQGRDSVIGSRRTDVTGLALLTIKDPDLAEVTGNFYAKVSKARKKSGSRTLGCGSARSRTLTVSAPQFHRADPGAFAARPRARGLEEAGR